jgi:NAD(P)-dependent dehydrogenase (short-subunit alcohol dehydrogenase family)
MSSTSSSSTNPYYRFKDLLPHFLVACLYVPFYSLWLLLTFSWPSPKKSSVTSRLDKPLGSTTSSSKKQKVAIVTGANSGIGYEAARALVMEHGMTVILACRSRDKAQTAAAAINQEVANSSGNNGKAVFCHPLDLASFDSVRAFAAAVKEQYATTTTGGGIQVLVNNAGLAERPGCTVPSQNGMDLIFHTNFLGHFLLTSLLMKNGVLAQGARIVNGTSIMYMYNGDYDINDAGFWKNAARQETLPHRAYGPSKLAALLFTTELNRRYLKKGLRSIAVNPGGV